MTLMQDEIAEALSAARGILADAPSHTDGAVLAATRTIDEFSPDPKERKDAKDLAAWLRGPDV